MEHWRRWTRRWRSWHRSGLAYRALNLSVGCRCGLEFVCRIPAGKYAKFVVHGNMLQAVAEAWQTIWQMELPRSFQCDFEEYQNDDMGDNAEVHIYIGLKE